MGLRGRDRREAAPDEDARVEFTRLAGPNEVSSMDGPMRTMRHIVADLVMNELGRRLADGDHDETPRPWRLRADDHDDDGFTHRQALGFLIGRFLDAVEGVGNGDGWLTSMTCGDHFPVRIDIQHRDEPMLCDDCGPTREVIDADAPPTSLLGHTRGLLNGWQLAFDTATEGNDLILRSASGVELLYRFYEQLDGSDAWGAPGAPSVGGAPARRRASPSHPLLLDADVQPHRLVDGVPQGDALRPAEHHEVGVGLEVESARHRRLALSGAGSRRLHVRQCTTGVIKSPRDALSGCGPERSWW